jgi:DNA-directed RNA polymerase
MKTGGRLNGSELQFLALSPEVWGYVTLRTLLQGARKARGITRMAKAVGVVGNLEVRWASLREQERASSKAEGRPNRVEIMRRRVKQVDPKSVRKWLRWIDDLETQTWANDVRVKLGTMLLRMALDTCPEQFTQDQFTRPYRRAYKTEVIVHLSTDLDGKLSAEHKDAAELAPWLVPMICPPKPWALNGQRYTGGYLTTPLDLFKETEQKHTSGIEQVVPDEVLAALNIAQATPFKINRAVLDVVEVAVGMGSVMLPVEAERDMPASIPGPEWRAMEPADRGKVKREKQEVHDHNYRSASKRAALRRQIEMARQFAGEEALWFPHNLDFRGRMYPIPQDLHPQADDFARGLLTFAEGKPLGASGLLWLIYYVASTYGLDKESRQEQKAWVEDNLGNLKHVARFPLGEGQAFWSKAAEPWQFLAAVIELENAFCHATTPLDYVSHLPIHVDGTCNGLQHLSAMGRDPAGAYATNLTAEKERQDIYQIVAGKVDEAVIKDGTGDKGPLTPALAWHGHVTRKVVKRGVMTTPYGLTDIGMRDQLLKDGWCRDLEGDVMPNANYMRDRMKGAIGDTVIVAIKIMEWMQHNAKTLAEAGCGMTWVTPAGLMVHQAYRRPAVKRVRTLLGSASMRRPTVAFTAPDADLLVGKQGLAIAPNVIHSYDAAHLQLTVNMAASKGLTAFSVIHDSYGSHACDMDTLGDCIRVTFVDIYEQDWLAGLQRDFEVSAEGVEVVLLPPPPIQGFDVSEVLGSRWFFA